MKALLLFLILGSAALYTFLVVTPSQDLRKVDDRTCALFSTLGKDVPVLPWSRVWLATSAPRLH
jgi:hypothetical protein